MAVTYDELTRALEALVRRLRGLQGRANGTTYELAPGVVLKVRTAAAERAHKYRERDEKRDEKRDESRYRKRDENGTQALRDTPSLSVSDLSSGPDPDSVVPDCLPENLTGRGAGERDEAAEKPQRKQRNGSAKKPRPARWTRVPADWEPNGGHRKIARDENVTLDRELANFRDWEFRTPRTDPDATFRTWLRRAGKDRERMAGYTRPPGQTEHEDRMAQEASRRPERRVYRPESEPKPIDLQATLAGVAQARKAMRT